VNNLRKIDNPSSAVLDLPLQMRAEIALRAAFEKVIEEHIRLGLPMHFWENDKMVEMSVEELREYLPELKQTPLRLHDSL